MTHLVIPGLGIPVLGKVDSATGDVDLYEEVPQSVAITPRHGPGVADGLRRCIECEQAFVEGDTWLTVTPVIGGYSIAYHSECYPGFAQPAD